MGDGTSCSRSSLLRRTWRRDLEERAGASHCGCLEENIQTSGFAENDDWGLSRRRFEVQRRGGERAVQSMEKLIRVHKLAIETRIIEKLTVRHPLFARLVEFCADLYNRFQVESDGKTAQQRLKVKHSNQVMVEFGTAVLFRVCEKVQGSSMC